jgi:hypothetical protein
LCFRHPIYLNNTLLSSPNYDQFSTRILPACLS